MSRAVSTRSPTSSTIRTLSSSCSPVRHGLTLADVDANVQFNIGTPSTITGQSGAYVESPNTTATLPVPRPAHRHTPTLGFAAPIEGAYALAIVGFNNVDTKSLTGIV
jgi:hypothetical protein